MPPAPLKAVHTWSLFRTLGRFVAPGSMPSGDLPEGGGPGLSLLDLPAALASHGYRSAQLCHFYLADRAPGYLAEVRGAFAEAGVEIECLLVDDGDITDPNADHLSWVSGWIAAAEELGAPRARVIAGQRTDPDAVALSAQRLIELADRHPGTRLVTENWHALLRDAATVNRLLDATDGRIGFLIDLGNWTGPGKYDELARVAGRAETCQAKVTTDAAGQIDVDDYRRCLTILRDAEYAGPLALVYDGADPDEWGALDRAYSLVESVFGDGTSGAEQ